MAYISLDEAYEQEFGVKNNKKTPQIKQTMSLDEAYKQEFGENSNTGKMSLDEAFADTFKPGEIMPMPFYKQAADYGLRTLGGVSSGLWNVAASGTDYVARLSDALSKTVGLSEGKELSPVAKKAREAAKWLAGQGKSASDYALQGRDPSLLDAVAQGLGSSAAFMLPSMAVGRAAQAGGIIPKALAYAATKGGLESITEGGSVFGAQLDKGATPEEAHAAALRAELLQFPINFASDAVGDLIGGGAAKGALKEATTQTLKKGAVETGRKILGRGTGELVQEAFQGVTSDRLSERKPDGTPWTWGDVLKAVPEMAGNIPEAMLKEGVPAFISAALIGAGEGVYGHRQQKKEQAAVQNAVQAKQAEILEDIQKNREQEQQRGEQFGVSEQLPQQPQIIEPVANVDLLPQQPKEQMQEQQPTVSETESVQKPKLPPKEERKGLIMWGREKMQELSAPAEFVEGEEQALNPLSDEDLQTYADIRRALKVNDYGKLAELKAGFDTQQQEAQAEQIQKPDNIVDANEMIEQEQMQEQMQAPVKQQQETNNIINFFNAAGKYMQEQRQYGDGIETDNIVNFNTLEEQAKAEDERLEAESKADAAKRIREKIIDEARDKRNARLVNAIKTKQKDATLGEIGVWIEALPDDEVSAFAREIIRKQPAGVKKAAINRLNERIEQVKAQESAEQRTPEISVDDGVMGDGQKKYTFSLKGNRPIEEATPNSVIHINGQEHFGVIDKEVADATGLPEGKIFVLTGDEHFGVQHIEKDHGKEIKALGYQDVKEFIADILHGYERVFKDSTGINKLDLVKSMRGTNNSFAAVELQAIDGGYVLKTAFPRYEKKLKNKELLYSRPAPLSTPVPHTEPAIGGSGRSVVESTTPSVTGKEALNRQSITPADSKSNTGVAVGANALNDNERIINAILTNGRTSGYPEFYSREWAQSIVDRMDDSAKAAAIKSIDDFKVKSVEEFKKNNPNREIDEKMKERLWSGLNTDFSVIVRGVMWDSPAKIDAQEEGRRRTYINEYNREERKKIAAKTAEEDRIKKRDEDLIKAIRSVQRKATNEAARKWINQLLTEEEREGLGAERQEIAKKFPFGKERTQAYRDFSKKLNSIMLEKQETRRSGQAEKKANTESAEGKTQQQKETPEELIARMRADIEDTNKIIAEGGLTKSDIKELELEIETRKRIIKKVEEEIKQRDGDNTGGEVSAAAVKAQGKESRVSTQAGDSVDTRFKVVEADDLIASHNEAFGENENYPQELQPRKRGRAASQHQVEHIISNLNPELLGDSKLASDGAPIVGSDNIVESGNGRVLALKLAYGRGQATEKQAQKYRQYLSDNAEQFGLSTEQVSSMKKPVLVRERTSDVDRKSFAQNANVSSVATMSSSETALKDADKLDIGMLESLNTDLDVLNSKDFISTFARDVVPKNELGTFIDDRGNLSQDGMRRVKNALFVKAYGDEQTLARMSESTDDNTRNISRALLQASTAVAPVQAKIKDGLLRKDLSMAEHIIQAANTLSSLRDKGMKVSEFLQQGNIFDEGGISPEARQILQFFDKNKQKPNVITNYLKDTARRVAAEGDGNQGSLFGGKQKSLNDILRSAESEATPKQKGLWDDIKKREAARKYIIDDATKQLKATGMEQSEIDSNVALMTAVFETFAEREGIGADELYKMYDIEFRKGDKAKGEDPNKVVMEVHNQKASHGSPANFDEFDLSFMSTGEGVQAFGWGLYFGQDRQMVDSQYRERLLKRDPKTDIKIFLNGREITNENKNPDVLHVVRRSLVASDFDIKRAVKGIESTIKMQEGWLADGERKFYAGEKQEILGMLRRNKEALKILESETLKIERNENTGQLYDVEIPDDHELLLWDKPVGEQPDVVKKALEKDSEEEVRRFESIIASYLDEIKNKGGEEAYELAKKIIYGDRSEWDSESSEKARVNYTRLKQLIGNLGIYENTEEDDFLASLVKEAGFSMPEENKVEELAREHNKEIKQPKLTGQEFYYSLSEKLGSDKAASLWLNDHGIKGHKFLDGNSRSRGEGTYNFVIYDDKAIEIKKKYYQNEQETAAERVNIVDIKDIPFIETSRRSNSGKTTYVDKKIKVSELPGNIQAIVKKKYRKNESPEFVDDKEVAAAIESANRKIIKEASESKLVKNFHKQGDIAFQSLSISSLGMVQKLRIHKSANHNRAQSSEYYVGIINNRLVYIRKSNHWGHFSTNVYESDNNPAYAGVEGDEFGRVGSKFHNWELKGADLTVSGEYKKISQAGFVYLDEYHQNEKGTGLHQKSVDKDTPRGSIEFSKNLGTGEISTVINFTALQDKSTCVHELGHLYYRLLADQARRMPDNPEVQTALAMAREFLGTKDGQGALTEDQQEKWANGWMNYVAEGKAPNAKLESVFKRFKKWLADLWANMTGRKDKVELTDGIRQVFDWLLTGDAAFDVRYDLDNALALAAEAEKFERLEQDAWQDIDKEYFDAIEAGDMETAQRIIDEQAQRMGYSSDSEYRMSHRAPNSKEDVNLVTLAESDLVPDNYWTTPKYYQHSKEDYESFYKINRAVNSNARGVHMFRAVPKDLKEAAFRNGDWITPSRDYANAEGAQIPGGYRIIEQFVHKDKIWWDGNSICEFGFDDGKNYAYKNTKNNLKLADVVVRDRDGKVVPPSKRFNRMKTETFYQRAHKQQATSDTTKSGVEVVKKAEDKRNYSGIMDVFNSPNIVADRHPRFAVFYRMAKDAYAKQERLRNNWQRAANKIFGKKGYISNQADRESLTEILLTGDAMGKVFSNEELAQLGADTNIIKAYRQIRGLYDNAHRMVSEQRKKYGKDELAYRKGYVPHFFRAWRVIKDGEIVDSHRSMNDAVKAAERLMESDGGKIKVAPALDDFGGQAQLDAITLGDVQYFKFIQKTADTFAMTLEEARDMTKDIAKMQNRSRVFKNALERKGYPGWDKDMEFALRRYLNLSARYIAMDTLKHDGIRMFERTFGRFKSEHSGLANYTKKFLEDSLGHPSKIEDSLNEWVRNGPLGKYIKDYIGDRPATVLANSIAKTVAIAKLGFCNASAAMINVTQLIGTNAIIGEANTFRGLVEYLRPTNKTKSIYEAIGITDDITMENPSGYSGIHRVGGRLGELSMSLFRIMDNMARKVTVLGAYRKATAEGKSHLEALEYARKVNDDVNFDYSVVDTPHFIRQLGPVGTLLFQFKKYPIKQLELALPGVGKLKGKEQLRYWAYASVMSGLFGLPAFEFIKNLIRGLWDDKDIEIEIKDAVTQSGLPQSVKDTLMYGALSNLDIDVGKRVGMGDFVPNGIEDLIGPSISTGIQLIRSLPKIYNNGSIIDTLEALSPGLSNPYKAFVAGETVDKRRGRTKFVYETTGEKLARATGSRPIRESKEADAVRSGNYNQRKQSEMERDAIDAIVEVWNKKNSPEYKRAAERCKKLKITYGRVEEEIQKRRKDEFRRKLESQPKTPAGRNRRAVMESYAGL